MGSKPPKTELIAVGLSIGLFFAALYMVAQFTPFNPKFTILNLALMVLVAGGASFGLTTLLLNLHDRRFKKPNPNTPHSYYTTQRIAEPTPPPNSNGESLNTKGFRAKLKSQPRPQPQATYTPPKEPWRDKQAEHNRETGKKYHGKWIGDVATADTVKQQLTRIQQAGGGLDTFEKHRSEVYRHLTVQERKLVDMSIDLEITRQTVDEVVLVLNRLLEERGK